MEALIDKKYCDGCVYLSRVYDNICSCDYVFIAGKRRPCPAGTGCTEKLVKKKRRNNLTVSKKGKKVMKGENVG